MTVWKKLAPRYEGKENQKHKILALDGGGIRGILTLEVLAHMEEMLAEATGAGPAFRLSQFFDYVGGTSTGAIIAAGLARGMSAKELLDFYEDTGPAMFDKQFILKRWKALYKSEPLKKELQKVFFFLLVLLRLKSRGRSSNPAILSKTSRRVHLSGPTVAAESGCARCSLYTLKHWRQARRL